MFVRPLDWTDLIFRIKKFHPSSIRVARIQSLKALEASLLLSTLLDAILGKEKLCCQKIKHFLTGLLCWIFIPAP